MYDYMAGKVDWLARGLPREGEKAAERRAIDLVVDDVVTSPLDALVADVRERVVGSRYGYAFVVAPGRVLLGRLRSAALAGDGALRAEDVMEPGPSTIRADTALEPLADRMRDNDLTTLPVTTPEGELLGVVRRDDLESELASGRS